MNWAFKIIVSIFISLFAANIATADDSQKDAWFGKDKFQHFTVSAFYSGGAAVVAHRHLDMRKNDSIIFGAAVTISLGGAKEIYDHSKPDETSSIKDFIWDIGGALAGGLVASLIL
jgi:putative lipoprotein